MRLSSRANAIEPSLTRKLFNLASQYTDVIDLTLGDPDLPTPQNIKDAACKAIQAGYTRYSANAGLIEARQSVAEEVKRNTGIDVEADGEVMLTVGGMEAIYLGLSCLVDEGDEVIIPAPYWVNYAQMVQMCGGIPIIVDTTEESGFSISFDKLSEAVSDKTKAIIVNSPNNPTGEILSNDILKNIYKMACEYDFFIISDEVYRSIIYDDYHYQSMFTYDSNKERILLVNSLSKKYCMTGWRVGYAAGAKELIANMTKLQENIAACTPLPSQYAAIEAFSGRTDNAYIQREFCHRREIITTGINAIPILSCRKPKGTFYLFVNISKSKMKSVEFAYKLLEMEHVAVVPGITYGKAYDDYIRIAFTVSEEKLKECITRLNHFTQWILKGI